MIAGQEFLSKPTKDLNHQELKVLIEKRLELN